MFHTFTCKEHEEYGHKGWVLDAKPYFDPGTGLLVAHDILEEFPGGKDQPHDELMALGAYMYGRGSMYRNQCYTLGQSVAHEFTEFFKHVFWEEGDKYALVPAPTVRPISDYHYGERMEDEHLRDVGTFAPQYLEGEFGDDECNRENLEKIKGWMPDALNWLRIGYRRAHKRFYPHLDGPDVSYLFDRIQREVDKILQIAELYDQLRIRVSYRRNTVDVWHLSPNGWEY